MHNKTKGIPLVECGIPFNWLIQRIASAYKKQVYQRKITIYISGVNSMKIRSESLVQMLRSSNSFKTYSFVCRRSSS